MLEGTLTSGEKIDVMEMMNDERFLHLKQDRLTYPTHRWIKYYSRLYIPENKLRRKHFAREICEQVDSLNKGGPRLRKLDFTLYVLKPHEKFDPEKFDPRIDETYSCPRSGKGNTAKTK